ncbi:hypothetical protein POVWA2_049980 [Plasmodium ovale wallikeri]|uniref:Uncharacterized protein n=1 Tax=Plasmodium ovale wallikeri TaxID=864142 RepID=A0A1A8YG14_PLAOA|nr:hypothetical protein POVWA1_001430 [Plasmodium ovale wallikeri]SBT45458.1 hypothetical protein POVWA2_049980 [Plasmodium ovale wallikeri]
MPQTPMTTRKSSRIFEVKGEESEENPGAPLPLSPLLLHVDPSRATTPENLQGLKFFFSFFLLYTTKVHMGAKRTLGTSCPRYLKRLNDCSGSSNKQNK